MKSNDISLVLVMREDATDVLDVVIRIDKPLKIGTFTEVHTGQWLFCAEKHPVFMHHRLLEALAILGESLDNGEIAQHTGKTH